MTRPAHIPADVNRPDRVLGPFTARQSVLLTTTAAALYGAWIGLRPWVPLPLFLAVALLVAAVAVAVALGQRDGLPLDRFLLAALRHHLNPHRTPTTTHGGRDARTFDADLDASPRTTTTPALRPGPARLLTHADIAGLGSDPAGPGVLDLGNEGLVAIAVVSTLNLGLHTPAEQDALLSRYARYLHSLTGPVQFLIRTVPVDLTGHLTALYEQAATLPHPALVTAALGHRAHLAHLATPGGHGWAGDRGDELTARQVLLVLTEPAGSAGGKRLQRRLEDAIRILATLDITVTPLNGAQISALLTDCTNPDHLTAAPSRTGRCDTGAAMAPVAITRRHPQAELDDHELEELNLAQDGPAHPAPRRHDAPDAWGPPPRATTFAPVDFTLAEDIDDDVDYSDVDYSDDKRDADHGDHAEDDGWFDGPSLPDHRGGYAARRAVDGPDGGFDLDDFDPGAAAARWWGQ